MDKILTKIPRLSLKQDIRLKHFIVVWSPRVFRFRLHYKNQVKIVDAFLTDDIHTARDFMRKNNLKKAYARHGDGKIEVLRFNIVKRHAVHI